MSNGDRPVPQAEPPEDNPGGRDAIPDDPDDFPLMTPDVPETAE